MTTSTCTITITVPDTSERFHEEDIVKQVWPYMAPWFTRRHGMEKGRIEINDGVVIAWKYETDYDEGDQP